MNKSHRIISFAGHCIRRRIAFCQFSNGGINPFPDLLYRTVEEARPGFNHERFDAELGGEVLRLQALLGVVSGEHLLGKSAIAFAHVNGSIALVTNDRRPRDVLCFQPDGFPRGDAPNDAQSVKGQILFLAQGRSP